MSTLPKIESYGNYSNDNYGAHCLRVDLGTIELYYSYKTIVGYRDAKDGFVCIVNQWGPTTGKHLNQIQSDHKKRIKADEFESMLRAALARHIS